MAGKDAEQRSDIGGATEVRGEPDPIAPPIGAPASEPSATDRVVQLTRVRRRIAENVTRSKATIPHAWQAQEVDMSGVVASRVTHGDLFMAAHGASLTYLPYVIKATATALRQHPEVNSTFLESELLLHGDINIGISIGLEDTLVVPVIRHADLLSVADIAQAAADLVNRARRGRLQLDDLQGGTFTVNNSGTFGTLLSYSVIVPGQSGILTLGAVTDRPIAKNGAIVIKPMGYLCFSLDHRVMDGLTAARFLTACRDSLEAITGESPIS